MSGAGKRLGEVLLEMGLLKPWQLELALQHQRTSKAFLGEILVQKGWLTEDFLLFALAKQFGISYVHLRLEDVDLAAAGQFSPGTARHPCVAIAADARTVTAAIANPLDAWAISALEQRAGSRTIRLLLAPAAEIRAVAVRVQQQAARAARRLPDALNDQPRRES
jgi:hypothetical protein